MFGYIQTDYLFLFGSPQTDGVLDDFKYHEHCACHPYDDCACAECLYAQQMCSAACEQTFFTDSAVREQTYCDSAPESVAEVYAACAYRVINFQL